MISRRFFPREHAGREPILTRRQWTGSESCKCARRINRAIEIQHDFAVFGRVGEQEAARAVSLFSAGLIRENKEQTVIARFLDWPKFIDVSIAFEDRFARNGFIGNGPNDVLDFHGARG